VSPFNTFATAAVLASGATQESAGQSHTGRPNIVFVLADDQRFDTIAALGNPQIQTPHLDALVARGVAFTRAHIPGGTCGAVCMPSRAMLHTGRTLFHLDHEGQAIPLNHTLLGEVFRQAGYAVFGTGKWHNGIESYARSFSDGDEIFFGGMDDHWNVPAFRFDPTGRYNQKLPMVASPMTGNQVTYRHADHITAGAHSTDLFADASIRFLERARSEDQPFFLYLSLMAPHDPRTMPEHFKALYDPDTMEGPANFLPSHPIDTGALQIRDEMLAAFPRDPAEIRRHIAEYYAMITHLDDALGRLVAALEANGQLDNTVIVFSGDNGLAVGQHGLMGKQNLYEHSVRVPLIFAGPGIPAGEQRDALVYLHDTFPTLCDLTGLAIPSSVEGMSLVPCLREPSHAVHKALLLAYADSIRGVTDGDFKLIQYAHGATQLFNLRADPLEMTNLAEQPSYNDRLKTMRAQLARMADQWDDAKHPLGKAFYERLSGAGVSLR
jgi:arylsulfatase A-like enzyme